MNVARTLIEKIRGQPTRLEWARSVHPFKLDPWQEKAFASPRKNVLLNVSRQIGKSTTAGTVGAYRSKYKPGALVLIFSPTMRQSFELFDKTRPLVADDAVEYNKHEATLANGSRIVCLPGSADTVRGFSRPDVVIVDEGAFVKEELYVAVQPMLATNPDAEFWVLSTGNGKVGFFYEQWTGVGDWERIEVWAKDCPRVSKEFLDNARKTMSRRAYEQEFECQFRDHVEQVFTEDMIEAAFSSDDVQPLNLEAP